MHSRFSKFSVCHRLELPAFYQDVLLFLPLDFMPDSYRPTMRHLFLGALATVKRKCSSRGILGGEFGFVGQAKARKLKIQRKPMRPDAQSPLCPSAGAVVGRESEFCVGSSSALVWVAAGNHIFCASHVPAPCVFRALFMGSERGLLKKRAARLFERVPHPAHEVRELAV